MKAIISIIAIFFLLGLNVSLCQVKLTYNDLKVGDFYSVTNGTVDTYIRRTKNRQIEVGPTDHVKLVLKISWENDSTYVLHFIRSNKEWDKVKNIKGNPDLIVKVTALNEYSYLQEAIFVGDTVVFKNEIIKMKK